MMFSEDESEVVLLDFQLMGLFHPAKDLWYFLSLATDADFRKAHLQDLLMDYFKVFNPYLKDAEIEMTFDQVILFLSLNHHIHISIYFKWPSNILDYQIVALK